MTAIPHYLLAGLVAALYGLQGAPQVEWLYRSDPNANVYFGVIRIGKFLIVVPRGSFDIQDWLHDLDARPIIPAGRLGALGRVHGGMFGGVPEAWDIITMLLQPDDILIFAGHSLGAARANLLCGCAVVAGHKPAATVSWGEPRSGFAEMAQLLANVPGTSYRNAVGGIMAITMHDPVTDVPPPIGYHHRVKLQDIDAGGDGDPMSRHHFGRYWPATPAAGIVTAV